ncbi:pentapeptide repeat-containing protein [archaeon]|nr:MAG: pentapeptide repeat-containing protein [archaeon]
MGKRQMSSSEIAERYKKGERDFSNTIARSQNFINLDLRGANFSHSDLSHSSFNGCDLQGADFSNSNLSWTDFTLADMKNAKFSNSNISYSVLNDATVDGADFRGVDFKWSLALNVNLESANIKGAQTVGLARNMSDITPEDMRYMEQVLRKVKIAIPLQTFLQISHNLGKTNGDFQVINIASHAVRTYVAKSSHSYGEASSSEYSSDSGAYSFKSSGKDYNLLILDSIYKKGSGYGKKK